MGYVLGIDLGTTFTAAAIKRGGGQPEIVGLGNLAAVIPSAVFLKEDGELLVGEAAERRGALAPTRIARAFKRRFGDPVPIVLDRSPYSADRLMTVLLAQVMRDVVKGQGASPDRVVLTHPANWGGYKIDLLRQAVQSAGVTNFDFTTEPVAAAVRYSSTERVEVGDIVAVYDLGGGTFDAAVLRKTTTGFETLGAPEGIERLGGIDFDDAVLAHVTGVLGTALTDLDRDDPSVRAALAKLREECVSAKEALSNDSNAVISVMLPTVQTQVGITRTEFEDIVRPIVRETVQSLRRTIDSAHLDVSKVKAVLLVGGSSRVPLVQELVRSEIGRPVVFDTHPKHAVALGAALIAAEQIAGAATPPMAAAPVAPVAATAVIAAAAVPVASVPAPPAPPPPAAPVAPVAAAAPPMAPPASAPSAPSAGGRKKGLIIGVAAAAVIAIGVVAVLAFGGGDSKSSNTAATTSTVAVNDTANSTTAPTAASTTVATGGPTTLLPQIAGTTWYTGPGGWRMQVPTTWTQVADPGANNDAKWTTGYVSGQATNTVLVTIDKGSSTVDLPNYMKLLKQSLPTIDPDAVVLAEQTVPFSERSVSELVYTIRKDTTVLTFISVVTNVNGVFYVGTWGGATDSPSAEIAQVEQVLFTLTPP